MLIIINYLFISLWHKINRSNLNFVAQNFPNDFNLKHNIEIESNDKAILEG